MSEFRHYVDSLYGTAIPNGFSTWKAALVTFSVAYLLLCRLLRFKRMRSMHQRFSYPSRDSLTAMTNEDAQKIQLYLAELEFPVMFSISLGFALFKVCTFGSHLQLPLATVNEADLRNAGADIWHSHDLQPSGGNWSIFKPVQNFQTHHRHRCNSVRNCPEQSYV